MTDYRLISIVGGGTSGSWNASLPVDRYTMSVQIPKSSDQLDSQSDHTGYCVVLGWSGTLAGAVHRVFPVSRRHSRAEERSSPYGIGLTVSGPSIPLACKHLVLPE